MSLRCAAAWLVLVGAGFAAAVPGRAATPPLGEPVGAPIEVAVSVGPLAEVVERIGGPQVRVTLLTPPATPPESWTPTPREALALARADLYVSVGHPLLTAERPHLESIAGEVEGLERLSLLETLQGTRSREVEDSDPHLWMDIDALAALADSVAAWLSVRRPEAARDFQVRLASYRDDLARLDEHLTETLAPPRRRPAVFQHPAWQRLLDRYGVDALAIEIEGKEPSPARLSRLIEQARSFGAETVFTQIGVSDRGARLLAGEIGAELVALDPTSSRWLETLRDAGQRLATAIR